MIVLVGFSQCHKLDGDDFLERDVDDDDDLDVRDGLFKLCRVVGRSLQGSCIRPHH